MNNKKIPSIFLAIILLSSLVAQSISFTDVDAWHVMGHVPDIDGGCVPAPGYPCPEDGSISVPQDPVTFCYNMAKTSSQDALGCFYDIIQNDPENIDALDAMVKLYYALGNYERAGYWVDATLKRDSSYLQYSYLTEEQIQTVCNAGNFSFCNLSEPIPPEDTRYNELIMQAVLSYGSAIIGLENCEYNTARIDAEIS